MDEPSAILDDSEIETLFDVVRRLTAEGVGVVYISHRLDEIRQHRRPGDRAAGGRDGGVRAASRHARPTTWSTRMVGATLEQLFPDRKPPREATVLEVRGLHPCPRRERRPRSSCARARCSASPGWSAPGRSELLRAIYGVDRPQSGEVLVDGRRLPPGRPDLAIAAGLGLAPEDRKSQALLLEWRPGQERRRWPTWPGSSAA